MKKRVMTNTEYLLRHVRDSERMQGWKDDFSKLRSSIMKDISKTVIKEEKESPEQDNDREL